MGNFPVTFLKADRTTCADQPVSIRLGQEPSVGNGGEYDPGELLFLVGLFLSGSGLLVRGALLRETRFHTIAT